MPATVRAFAAPAARAPLGPTTIERRDPRPTDVELEVLYCGICHSDLHQARAEWGEAMFPMVPGHEIVGRVRRVGQDVRRFAPGDLAGVGCFVDSCRTCRQCTRGLEQYCEGHLALTYNGTEKDGTPTFGGYSQAIVVDEAYALKVPSTLPLERVAPLLCAGITTYSPLKHWRVGPGQRLGVVGLGGLGHMAVKLGAAMGAEVTVVSTSPKKEADARRLGAHAFLLSSDPAALEAVAGTFDLILDTVSASHDVSALLRLLRVDGTLVLVGAPEKPLEVPAFSIIPKRRALAGSMIGGIRETQEMLDFCAAHGIGADVEVIPVQQVNEAYERMLKNDVRYRFVIDTASLG
ncbi:MAG: NAD(P)-dependent alcohol dehydrogenase [Planctomycetes bacterium]|nr:NAD(P)-dependent alcohol dehydrogenase [Planctomycetota bacterium]